MYGLNLKGAGDLGHCGCNRMPGQRAPLGQRPRLCKEVRYLQGYLLLSELEHRLELGHKKHNPRSPGPSESC